MSDERDLLEEHLIRRALRLDADEVPPRLEPALIAAAARIPAAHGQANVGLAVAVAFAGGWLWSQALGAAVAGITATSGVDPLAAVIRAVTAALVAVAPVADAATHPAIPIAILTAAAVAALFEHRGRSYAASS